MNRTLLDINMMDIRQLFFFRECLVGHDLLL